MNGSTLLAIVAVALIGIALFERFGREPLRPFFVLEDLGEDKHRSARYSLAWNQGFRTAREARLMAKVLRDENRYMEGATLKINYWDGKEWSPYYEPV